MKWIIFLMLTTLVSCSDDKFRNVEELDGFRIIGIQTANPEVNPGDAGIGLRVYLSDTKGGGRVINGTVEACIDPGIALGAEVSCKHDPTRVTDTYTIDTVNDADLGAANRFTGLATAVFNANVPAIMFVGRSAREQNNGVAYIVIFRFSVDGKVHEAFKRITATNRAVKNSNPSATAVNLNGFAITTKPRKGDKLLVTANAPENYQFIEVDGTVVTRTEELKVAWYVSEGEVNLAKSDVDQEVEYTSNTPSGTMVILTVVRDDRGGIDIERQILP